MATKYGKPPPPTIISRYHVIQNVGLCIYCHKWCEQCNQCKCEIKRLRLCPQFDVKLDPVRFQRWNLELELEYLINAQQYDPKCGTKKWVWYQKRIWEIKNILGHRGGHWKDSVYDPAYDEMYCRRDTDGLAYYDR